MKKIIFLILSLMAVLISGTAPIYADTDGTEMQILQPEKLEIQLGTDWAGVEFRLKTDAGVYPGVIPVDEDGILRMEIGGSSTYILSCADSSAAIPGPDETPAEEEPDPKETVTPEAPPTDQPQDTVPETEKERKTVAGIPMLHILFFGGGLFLAIVTLIIIRFSSRMHAADAEYEEDAE